jgi:hypothetical protein
MEKTNMSAEETKALVRLVLTLGLEKLGVTVTEELMNRTLDFIVPTVQERISEFRDVKVRLVD